MGKGGVRQEREERNRKDRQWSEIGNRDNGKRDNGVR